MKRLIAILVLAGTMAADCPFGDDKATGPDLASVAGTYTLQSVNGDPVPSNFNDNGTTVVITSGSATLNANGTFTYSETIAGTADVTTGTYSKTGDTYTFVPNAKAGEGPQTNGIGTFSGTTLTLTVSETGKPVVTRILTKN